MKKVELLAPAGSPEALDAAIGEGADAVYLGLKSFNARMRTTNFAYSQFEAATRSLHRQNRKIYVTVNTVFEQREADRMYQLLKYLAAVGPDGIIVQDFGTARMARECFPSLKLHASTQMNIGSAKAANVLSRHGFSRVVLSRELDLQEIQSVREGTSVELEVFVHGALCVSASGLCLFSSYLGGKSANRGMCAQACRRRYHIGKSSQEALVDGRGGFDFGDAAEDARSPDEGASGYFFSPSDLQLIALVPDLVDSGVSSLKIEGRMKSAEYVGSVVSAYRRVLDNIDGDQQKAIAEAKNILRDDFARSKTVFYFDGGKPADWLDPRQVGGTGLALGPIESVRGAGDARVGLIRPDAVFPEVGDSARFHRADDSDRKSMKLSHIEKEGENRVWISIPSGFGVGDSVYLIQTRAMSKRYPHVLPNDLASFRRTPGREAAPNLSQRHFEKAERDLFPDGLYTAASRIEDLYILQSSRTARVILGLTRSIAKQILDGTKGPLPFSKGELILSLDPFFPEGDDKWLSEDIPRLMEAGYRQFVVNNLGHLVFFRGTDAKLIAGPYLYTFNRWAHGFVDALNLSNTIAPLEINRQNLDRVVDAHRRPGTFVTIFAYPALFRIRADLSSLYDFSDFSDGRGENFRLIPGDDGSIVVPEQPFSIVDKIPFLKESGFSKFILDFSGPPLRKRDYKDVIAAAKVGRPLPNTTRFNWKDGFYTQSEGFGEKGSPPTRPLGGKSATPSGSPRRGLSPRGKRRT